MQEAFTDTPRPRSLKWLSARRRQGSIARITPIRKGARAGLADRLKGLTKKAEDTAVERKDEIHQAVQKAEVIADQRTGGKYREQIQKAAAKADRFVDGLQETKKEAAGEGAADGEGTPRAS